jgi:predicted nucleotidyltransferase component of viral defense system
MEYNIIEEQNRLLNKLANKVDDFYLAGGTALTLFHLDHHRQSDDLDFFTKDFNSGRVLKIIEGLKVDIKENVIQTGQELSDKFAKMMTYNIEYNPDFAIKLDFVEDVLPFIEGYKNENGINVLSAPDIYLRKLYAVSGIKSGQGQLGEAKFRGGRQEAKDLFDIYYLSEDWHKLGDFVINHCPRVIVEGVIVWFNTFDRRAMKEGLSKIKTKKVIEFSQIEKHLKVEIGKILEQEIGL